MLTSSPPPHYFYRLLRNFAEQEPDQTTAGCTHYHENEWEAWNCPSEIKQVAEVIELVDSRQGLHSYKTHLIDRQAY